MASSTIHNFYGITYWLSEFQPPMFQIKLNCTIWGKCTFQNLAGFNLEIQGVSKNDTFIHKLLRIRDRNFTSNNYIHSWKQVIGILIF